MKEPYQKYFKFYPWILCPKYHFFGASFFGNWQILTVDQPSLQDFSLRSEGTSLDFFVIVRTANLLKGTIFLEHDIEVQDDPALPKARRS